MKYGSHAAISEGFSSGWVFVAAQRMAWEMVMSRKSSQASASSSFIFFLKAFSSGPFGDVLDGFGGLHVDRALAFHHVQHAQVVAEVRRDRLHMAVGPQLSSSGRRSTMYSPPKALVARDLKRRNQAPTGP
jgi:hypothetical protein